MVVVGVVIGVVMWGRGLVSAIPSVALAALVVFAAIKLVNVSEFRRLARFRRSELFLAVATAVCVPVFGVLNGVLAAVVLSILELCGASPAPTTAFKVWCQVWPACTMSTTTPRRN